ncbi:hypothetical protein HanPSC8_Chr02g0074041 [Helianthus annuus]|nr:hypothetical protein HanPSC8_Chr02g0074041 [Helianthus annuus]
MSSFAWWGYTGNKHIARVKTGQDNDRSVCHRGRLFTNDIFLNELATLTTFSFRDVRFLRHDHSELKDSCSTAH